MFTKLLPSGLPACSRQKRRAQVTAFIGLLQHRLHPPPPLQPPLEGTNASVLTAAAARQARASACLQNVWCKQPFFSSGSWRSRCARTEHRGFQQTPMACALTDDGVTSPAAGQWTRSHRTSRPAMPLPVVPSMLRDRCSGAVSASGRRPGGHGAVAADGANRQGGLTAAAHAT